MSAIAMGPQVSGRAGARVADARRVSVQHVATTRGAGLHGLTLTGRGRALLLVMALAMVAVTVLLGGRALAEQPSGTGGLVEHVVVQGETLWGIASASVAPGESVSTEVRELVRVNHLPSADVMAGQTILVPAG
ncbi:LysM peptidoglycan-binding domain-containing protein [Cellulomonas sp. HZM]|uniref:LysM peptidoglycan-binding domain-containing protein n=1 Tax=Cellulomonas sp. HZM TaxID=1454010 RepID=UPI00068AAE53|nr:LysM peptidoglycan-binding domain-containing protein [Cellulomonas sp. HZM]